MPRTDITFAQRKRARRLRANMTGSEQALWRLLKGGRMMDCHFRRQAAIGDYVADFVCFNRRLVIEADGDQHGWPGQAGHDASRDAWLASQGFRVLRFTNGDILRQRESVTMTVEAALEGRLPIDVYAAYPAGMQRPSDRPPSQPSPTRGEGLASALEGASPPPSWGRDGEGGR